MNNIRKTIQEIITKLTTKDKCNCGCHDCDNVGNPGVVINESLNAQITMTENLRYHVENKLPLTENTFRYGSKAFLDLWAEARYLYVREAIHVNDLDKEMLTETNLGEYGIFEGQKVPLDMPMVYENQYEPILEDIRIYGAIYESVNIDNAYDIDDIKSNSMGSEFIFTDKHGIKRKLMILIGNSIKLLWFNPSTQEWTTDEMPSKYGDEKAMNTFGMLLVKVILPKYGSFNLKALGDARYRLFRALIYNGLDTSKYEMDYNDDLLTITVTKIDNISEDIEIGNEEDVESAQDTMLLPYADLIDKLSDSYHITTNPKLKKLYGYLHDEILDASMNRDSGKINQIMKKYGKFLPTNLNEEKKDPPIGKPKRGGAGGKKYYVYVRNPKTKNIKKVSFGDSGGLKTKFNNPKARKAFAARHKCAQKTDRTKASYWSCRIGRYWKQLGGSKNFSGFW
jgi:hypothetical protein